jgi:hypothetical protein
MDDVMNPNATAFSIHQFASEKKWDLSNSYKASTIQNID